MTSVTITLPDHIKEELKQRSWINWSKVAEEVLIKNNIKQELLKKLETPEEKELEKWSVELGRKLKKDSFKKLLDKLPPEERKKLLR